LERIAAGTGQMDGEIFQIHGKKLRGRAMPGTLARTKATKSTIRARVEHVFAGRAKWMNLFNRTTGLARVEATITLTNLVYYMKRWCWL